MKIQLINLNVSDSSVAKEIENVVSDVIKRKAFILGKEVDEFEREFADYCGCKYGIGVSSGTSALFLSLRAIGVNQGDFVITTPFTFTATAEVIVHCGATPIFVDIDENTCNIDPNKIEECFKNNKNKIKALLPVHIYGQPANMFEIKKIAQKYGVPAVEDAAQAHGAKVKTNDGSWQTVGSFCELGCFSFYPTKNLGAYGDGGMITTNDEKLYKNILQMRNHGRLQQYLHDKVGYNERLDNIQAAILLVKLKQLDKWNESRRTIAALYDSLLKDAGDIITPSVADYAFHVYHLYVIRTKHRDSLAEFLRNQGIGTAVQYGVPLNLQPAFKNNSINSDNLANSQKVAAEVLSLPLYPGMSIADAEYVAEQIRKYFKK